MKKYLSIGILLMLCMALLPLHSLALTDDADETVKAGEAAAEDTLTGHLTLPMSVTEADIKAIYPITPDDPIWKTFTNHAQMVAACSLEAEVVEAMTTEELVKAVLMYPMLIDIYAYNNMETALDQLANQSDAYRELRKREDGADCLMKTLQHVRSNPDLYYTPLMAEDIMTGLLSDEAFGISQTDR